MSRLEELIQEYCPNGVEYKELQSVLKIKNGKDYKSLGAGDIPVYGSGGIMTYVDSYVYDKPSVLIPRKGSIDKLYYVDTPFWNVDTVFYTEINVTIVLPRYVFHCLLREHLEKLNTAGGVPSLTQKVLNVVKIPVPPLPVQEEIVRILDSFTQLTAELQEKLDAELQARKKQYEYYADVLFANNSSKNDWLTVSNVIVSLKTGLNPRQNFKLNVGGNKAYVTGKDIYNNSINISEKTDLITDDVVSLINKRACLASNDVLFASTGTGTVGRMAVVSDYDNSWAVSETMFCLKPKEKVINPYYLMYALYTKSAKEQYTPKISKGSVPHLKVADLLNVKIPVPNMKVQESLISLLRNFDTICNDLSSGLPAEIQARQKQYEYYRDKLLTFPPLS